MDPVDRALATLDPETARRADSAISTLIGHEGERLPVELLCQLEVQDFLWGKLPKRWWPEEHEPHEVAWALGDIFELLGQAKYAALCRDRRTHEILAAWHRDEEAGAQLASKAIEETGLMPPDTSVLAFGQVMGNEELRAFMEISVAIEAAIDAGQLSPGDRHFARDRTTLCERVAAQHLPVVRRERAEAWAMGFRGERDWLSPVLPVLEQSDAMPVNVELSLVPARAVLERIGAGVTLTGSGYLPPAVAIELNDRFRWSDNVGRAIKKERDVPPLVFVREHLTRQRLLQVRKGVVSVTARGRACLSDDLEFWERLTNLAPRFDPFESEVIAVAAALLLESPDVEREDLIDEVALRMRHRWKGGSGDFRRDVHWTFIDWYRIGLALGWWEAQRGRWVDRLSPRGVGAAARAFWSVAGAPSTQVP